MFDKKKRLKGSDDLVNISFCSDTAILLYKTIDNRIMEITNDTAERATLKALRASLNYELYNLNINTGNI
jgi:hypothetical protein